MSHSCSREVMLIAHAHCLEVTAPAVAAKDRPAHVARAHDLVDFAACSNVCVCVDVDLTIA